MTKLEISVKCLNVIRVGSVFLAFFLPGVFFSALIEKLLYRGESETGALNGNDDDKENKKLH